MNETAHHELVLTAGPPANGGSCVARHDGRVVFVRYALPGERVRARVTDRRDSYWHAEAVEILEPSGHRIEPLCPIAGPDGAGCCDLAFAEPAAARLLKAQVVANQLSHLAGFQWTPAHAEPVGSGAATGWRTRVRLAVGNHGGRAGFHRYHSAELVTGLGETNCGQLPPGMLAGLDERRWPAGTEVHVVLDDAGDRHVVRTGPGRTTRPEVVEGSYLGVQRCGSREWRVPVTAFWQAHREAAQVYAELVRQAGAAWDLYGGTAWDLYGGAGLFAAVLADAVGRHGRVVSVDTSRAAGNSARRALSDLPQVQVLTESVRNMLARQRRGARIAVLDPPRAGAGREVIGLLAAKNVSTVIHIGCEAASFARDVGLYLGHGYRVEALRVFDSFPLTHHVECAAVLAA